MTGIICYHLQQYVEKSVKAKLCDLNIPFRKTHDIRQLLRSIPGECFPDDLIDGAEALTSYCVSTRYDSYDPPKEKMIEAFRVAERIVSVCDTL